MSGDDEVLIGRERIPFCTYSVLIRLIDCKIASGLLAIRMNLPADTVGVYRHAVSLSTPDTLHDRLDLISESFRDARLALIFLFERWG